MKERRIEFEVRGENIPGWLVAQLKQRFKRVRVEEDDEESVDVFQTAWYQRMKAKSSPGRNLKHYRENRGLSQGQLARKLGPGVMKQHVSAMERGRRGISKSMAKKLAQALGTSPARFI